jgi:outer membrane protein
MNKPLQSLLAVAALALTAVTAHAQAAPKILVVDLSKLFDNHWKTQEQNDKLKADEAKAQDQLAQITKDGNALVEQFKELDEQSKNPTATADAKAKATADAQKKMDEIQQKRSEQNSFIQSTQNTLRQRYNTFKTLMIEEISKVAVDIAKGKGATFLIDKSGPSLFGVPNIIYSDPALDITDEVAAVLNKDRPSPTPAPAATAAPAAAAPAAEAPAAGGSPAIVVPGLSK